MLGSAFYGLTGLSVVATFVMASADAAPPPWSLVGVIVTLAGALVYVFRKTDAARTSAEAEKYALAIKTTEALTQSSLVLARALDFLEEEPRHRRRLEQ